MSARRRDVRRRLFLRSGRSVSRRRHRQEYDVIIAGSVTDEEAKKTYPQGWKSPRPYIRIVPQPKA